MVHTLSPSLYIVNWEIWRIVWWFPFRDEFAKLGRAAGAPTAFASASEFYTVLGVSLKTFIIRTAVPPWALLAASFNKSYCFVEARRGPNNCLIDATRTFLELCYLLHQVQALHLGRRDYHGFVTSPFSVKTRGIRYVSHILSRVPSVSWLLAGSTRTWNSLLRKTRK